MIFSPALEVSAQDVEDSAVYDQLVKDALSEFRAHRYQESRALFAQAHALKPSARTFRGMGQAAFQAALYGRAIVDLTGALDSDVNPLTLKMRLEVERILSRARNYTGRYELLLEPADSQITVDGGPPVLDQGGALLLDMGRHEIVARNGRDAERTRIVQVAGGEDQSLDMRLSPADTLGAAAAQTPDASRAMESQPPPANAVQLEANAGAAAPATEARPFPWLSVAAFGAAAVATGFGIWQWQVRGTRADFWSRMNCATQADPVCAWFESGKRRATTWSIVSFGLAAAFATTGVVLLVIPSGSDSEGGLRCGIGTDISVACRLRM